LAIKYLSGGRITLLSTDVKPQAPVGSTFIETDTGDVTIAGGGFESLQEAWGNTQRPQNLHFVHFFSGVKLSPSVSEWGSNSTAGNIWHEGYVGGDNTRGMSNEVDGGYYIVAGSGVGYCQYINFNNKEEYNPKGSVQISVCKDTGSGQRGSFFTGLMKGTPAGSSSPMVPSNTPNHHAGHYKRNEKYNKVSTADGTTQSVISLDWFGYTGTAYHVYRTELKPTVCEFSINGIHVATKSLNLPANTQNNPTGEELQPTFSCYHDGGSNPMHILYMEAYNSA